MISKVILPLQLKVIGLLSLLLCSSILFYVSFAADLFVKDKQAYIYETGLTYTESLGQNVSRYLSEKVKMAALIQDLLNKSQKKSSVHNIFQIDSDLMDVAIYEKSGFLYPLKAHVFDKNLPIQELSAVMDIPFELIQQRGQVVTAFTDNEIPHLALLLHRNDQFLALRLRMDQSFKNLFKGNFLYQSFLADETGEIVYSSIEDASKIKLKNDLDIKSYSSVTETIDDSGEKFLMTQVYLENWKIFLVSRISRRVAFAATDFLKSRSIYVGLFILSLALIVGTLFSRSLTKPLNRLFQAVKDAPEKNFDLTVNIKSRDEIGVLGHSFNQMSAEIQKYMAEMAEKTRLANELKVAQLVQSTFFPQNEVEKEQFHMAAYYEPASECGGDWWGHFTYQNKLVFAVADATGHGAPAALLTATINCALQNLKNLMSVKPILGESVGTMMTLLNQAIWQMGGRLNMTCFLGVLDLKTLQFKFANASHHPPFLLPVKDSYSRQDFKPLMVDPGSRLGEKAVESYAEGGIDLNIGQKLVLFTDGLIECHNDKKEEYGKRKFMRSLAKHMPQPVANARDRIVGDALSFVGEQTLADDLTLILLEVKAQVQGA